MIRDILRSDDFFVEGTDFMNEFPYSSHENGEPQYIDPITDYVLDWNSFSNNKSVFEFPKDEFDMGMRVERGKDGKSPIFDVARKVIDRLAEDPQFYSNMANRRA